jgi:hypothetical protein
LLFFRSNLLHEEALDGISNDHMRIIGFPCGVSEFPCRYLGLPPSLKKLTKAQIQPIVDQIADQQLGWKVDLMNTAGRAMQVHFVMTVALMYVFGIA